MELQSISSVSKQFNVSTRTLRYYEQIGLLHSIKKDGYMYRTYNESTIRRLQQIIILRKLRISLNQIKDILNRDDSVQAINIFEQNIKELADEITALSTIKTILQLLIDHLNKNTQAKINLNLLNDANILEIVDSLTISKINFKEDKTMENLNNANKILSKLKDVRIVYLPPVIVASIHRIGGKPEDEAIALMNQFIKDTKLDKCKPDFRVYGFNHPCGELPDGSDHGYEFWITIPDNMELMSPFVKKTFDGGLYAAHMIPMGAFEQWHWLCDWAENNDKYEPDWGCPDCMNGLIEEHLNYIHLFQLGSEERNSVMQLDLLIPIKER